MRVAAGRGVTAAVVAGLAFGASGALAKPVLLSGWSPGATVTVRALLGAAVLAPFAVRAMRGHWPVLRAAWPRVVLMGLVGVAGTQLAYFAAVERIPVATAALLEYLSPVALVAWAWARSRRTPRREVLAGTAVAAAGLLLVIGPGAVRGTADPLGLSFGLLAMTGCAAYFLIAARVGDGLPPVALAATGLLLGGVLLGTLGAVGVLPLQAGWGPVEMAGRPVPVIVPLVALGVVATALAYATSIAATELLGSRVASFFGLLEVVAATGYAWLLLAEPLRPVQGIGGAAILLGIALVRRDRRPRTPTAEPPAVPVAVPLGP